MYLLGEKVVCFSGENSVLSNLARYHLQLGQVHFNSTEQAYQWSKLRWLGLYVAADELLGISSPHEVMMRAREKLREVRAGISDPSETQRLEENLMTWRHRLAVPTLYQLALHKADSYPEFKQRLVNNADKLFVEATTDHYWGCGLNYRRVVQCVEADESGFINSMPGQNVMGQILGDVAREVIECDRSAQPYVRRGFYDHFAECGRR